ncbi:MAG: hypothetical protein AAGA03_18665 [Planctomycetota bacterium]
MRNTLTLIALLLSMTACGQSEPTGPDMETKGRAADAEMADGTLAALPDLDESTANVPRPGGMANHPLSRYFNGDGSEALDYIGRFWFVCDPDHTAYIEEKCDEAVERGIRIGRQVGIQLTRGDLVDPDYWEVVTTQVHEMKNNQRRECERNYDGPRLKAAVECRKARDQRVNALLAELSVD